MVWGKDASLLLFFNFYVMRNLYAILCFAFFLNMNVFAQEEPTFTFDDIKNWTGSGTNCSALAVQWIDGTEWEFPEQQNVHLLAWGYRWDDGTPGLTGETLIREIAKSDSRLFVIMGDMWGEMGVFGFGYDADNDGYFAIRNTETSAVFESSDFQNGVLYLTESMDVDNFVPVDAQDYWMGGWKENYTSYYLGEGLVVPGSMDFEYSQVMSSLRFLGNNSWDVWTLSSINGAQINTYVFSEWMAAAEPKELTGIQENLVEDAKICLSGHTLLFKQMEGYRCHVVSVSGQIVASFFIGSDYEEHLLGIPSGVYIVWGMKDGHRVSQKIVVQAK